MIDDPFDRGISRRGLDDRGLGDPGTERRGLGERSRPTRVAQAKPKKKNFAISFAQGTEGAVTAAWAGWVHSGEIANPGSILQSSVESAYSAMTAQLAPGEVVDNIWVYGHGDADGFLHAVPKAGAPETRFDLATASAFVARNSSAAGFHAFCTNDTKMYMADKDVEPECWTARFAFRTAAEELTGLRFDAGVAGIEPPGRETHVVLTGLARTALFIALLACGGRNCPRPVGESARAPCAPYIEAVGAYGVPPAGWITFRSGTQLKVTDVPLGGGMFEVTPLSDDTYRVRGGGRVYFAGEHQIADGVLARRGAAAALSGLDRGKLGVYPSNNRQYLVPCDAIATAPLDGVPFDEQPVPHGKLRVVLEHAGLVDGNESEIWQLGQGQQVELLSVDGDRAEVRFERDGYVYRGRMVHWADDGTLVSGVDLLGSPKDMPWPETRIEQNAGGDALVMLGRYSPPMQSFGASCSGTAILRARSPMLSGPIVARDRRSNNSLVREIPALDRDVEVRLRSVFEDYRAIEIADPTREVTSIVAWVRASDLDRPTCAGPETSSGPSTRRWTSTRRHPTGTRSGVADRSPATTPRRRAPSSHSFAGVAAAPYTRPTRGTSHARSAASRERRAAAESPAARAARTSAIAAVRSSRAVTTPSRQRRRVTRR